MTKFNHYLMVIFYIWEIENNHKINIDFHWTTKKRKHKFPLYIFYGRAQNEATTKYSSIIHDECYLSIKEKKWSKAYVASVLVYMLRIYFILNSFCASSFYLTLDWVSCLILLSTTVVCAFAKWIKKKELYSIHIKSTSNAHLICHLIYEYYNQCSMSKESTLTLLSLCLLYMPF